MGILHGGIFGAMTGKVGGSVGSRWKSKNTLRTYRDKIANPRTAKQVIHRTKFAKAAKFFSPLTSTICQPLFNRAAKDMSGYNMAVSKNIECFAENALPQWDKLVISEGVMQSTAIYGVEHIAQANAIRINFNQDAGEGFKLSSDIAYVLVYDEKSGTILFSGDSGQERSQNFIDLHEVAYEGIDMLKVHVYLAFRRVDGLVVGKTSHYVELPA